jgi:hypothetical protein
MLYILLMITAFLFIGIFFIYKVGKNKTCIGGDCTNKTCGNDLCGNSCGTCKDGYSCVSGNCKCQDACGQRECGSNGCGESCGICQDGFSCENGYCKSKDKPECDDNNPCMDGLTCINNKCQQSVKPIVIDICKTGDPNPTNYVFQNTFGACTSCNNCSLNGLDNGMYTLPLSGKITCNCQKSDGSSVQSQLDWNRGQCVENKNGNLSIVPCSSQFDFTFCGKDTDCSTSSGANATPSGTSGTSGTDVTPSGNKCEDLSLVRPDLAGIFPNAKACN